MPDAERRKYRRLDIRLPLECRRVEDAQEHSLRTVSLNVSSGGLYFETDAEDIEPGMLVDLELTVPPGDGHWPWHGRISATAEVVRTFGTETDDTEGRKVKRIGVAARFRERLKLSF